MKTLHDLISSMESCICLVQHYIPSVPGTQEGLNIYSKELMVKKKFYITQVEDLIQNAKVLFQSDSLFNALNFLFLVFLGVLFISPNTMLLSFFLVDQVQTLCSCYER